MSDAIKAEMLDLGPHNGMGEPDAAGSYHAFTLTDPGDKSDEPQSLTFMVPSHQLPEPQKPVSQWQSIHTAPKDGTKVLLALGGAYSGVALAMWWPDFCAWVEHEPCEEDGHFGIGSAIPTHWMPLPEVPA